MFPRRTRARRARCTGTLRRCPTGISRSPRQLHGTPGLDDAWVTGRGSFGAFAHGYARAGAPPWKVTTFGTCARARSTEPFFHHWQEVHRQLAARRAARAPAHGGAGGERTEEACGLPDGFYESSEAHSLGLWLLGGETSVAERRLLVEEPDSQAFGTLLMRRSLDAAGLTSLDATGWPGLT